jgi:deferrochelatase/peroxidase EfeB
LKKLPSITRTEGVVEGLRLQPGIYLLPEQRPPNAFLFATLDIAPSTDSAAVRNAVSEITDVLRELQGGGVRDLQPSRAQEVPPRPIDPGTFDFLIGYGASFFDRPEGAQQLTEHRRPALLAPLGRRSGPFSNLAWGTDVPNRAGEGDLCLQLTGRDAHAVSRAVVEVWKAIHDHQLQVTLRETYDGFARDDGRSWIGFHDGVSNIRRSQRRVAVECTGDPDWNRGGTYLAFLRLEIDLATWRDLSREAQEILVGRDKLSGCALEAVDEENGRKVPRPYAGCPAAPGATPQEQDLFRDPPESGDEIVEASHIHRANQNRSEPTTAAGHRIFRQGYEYLDAVEAGTPRLGLNFVSFQRDLEDLRQVLGLSSWLGDVNFGGRRDRGPGEPSPLDFLSLRAGGFYAVPPREDPFPGAGLFG